MATPSSTFTEIVSTTLRDHPGEVFDNVSANNALLRFLKKKGKITKLSGGYEIARTLEFAENSTYQRFSGWDTLNIEPSEVLTAAKYDWCEAAVHVSASNRELLQNSGSERMIDLAKARIKNALNTAANYQSIDLYSTGALSNQIGGLGHIIQTNGEGTVGGIVSGTYTFWKNKFKESGTPAAATILAEMNELWLNLVRGADQPDLIVSTHDLYAFVWAAMQANQRYVDDVTTAEIGFQSITYQGKPLIFDTNSNFATTGEKMYFLNTKYLEFIVHRDANWKMHDEKVSINQMGVLIPIVFMGQLSCTNRALQGVLFD